MKYLSIFLLIENILITIASNNLFPTQCFTLFFSWKYQKSIVPSDQYSKTSSSYSGKDRQKNSAETKNMKTKPGQLSTPIQTSFSRDVVVVSKKERMFKEKKICKKNLALQYERIGSNTKLNEREVKEQKPKKSKETQTIPQKPLYSDHTLPEIFPISHENVVENCDSSFEVQVPSGSDVAMVSEVTKVCSSTTSMILSEDMKKLRKEIEELRIKLSILDSEI